MTDTIPLSRGLVRRARSIIDAEAEALYLCHTWGGEWGSDQLYAKRDYEVMVTVVNELNKALGSDE